MPRGDGTGPLGYGPGYGRGYGWCWPGARVPWAGWGRGRGAGFAGYRGYAGYAPEALVPDAPALKSLLTFQAEQMRAHLKLIEQRLAALDKESETR